MPDITHDFTARGVVERYRRAKDRRGVWESHWEFSCWNDSDPNRGKMLAIRPDDRVFKICLRIARRALAGTLKDPTHGATHYHAKDAAPPWARNRKPSAVIGNHKFYNDVE